MKKVTFVAPSTVSFPDAHVATKVVKDAARELRDDALHELCLFLYEQNQRQQAWVDTMIKESAAQSVVVPS